MAKIEITQETYDQLCQFSQLSKAASDIDLPLDQLADFLIQSEIDQMLGSILGAQEPGTLLTTILQLGRRHPQPTYGHLVDLLASGKEVNQQKRAEIQEQ